MVSHGEDLSALKTVVQLADGTSVTVRPIHREDAATEWKFVRWCSWWRRLRVSRQIGVARYAMPEAGSCEFVSDEWPSPVF
jgi:ribosomal protein S19E (S16A)